MKNYLSIYIHWPFCLSKCPYCDFNSHVVEQVAHDIWLQSYISELEYFKTIISNKYIRSIFFGGGTPSLMKPYVVEGIIQKIAELAIIDEQTEITIETNPTSFESKKFKDFRLAGINRVSVGVQSLIEADLKALGRQHDVKQGIETIEIARNLFPQVSFDLIYARTNQTLLDWQNELSRAMQFASGHISLYQLMIEKGTLFYKLFNEGNLTIPDTDIAADMYEWTNYYLKTQGYNRYEISNYALLGQECKHNLTYWQYNNYLGIGPGAHSRINAGNNSPLSKLATIEEFLGEAKSSTAAYIDVREERRRVPTTKLPVGVELGKRANDTGHTINSIMMWHKPEKWLQAVQEQGCGIQSLTSLSRQEIMEEILMMGLRLEEGISVDVFQTRVDKQVNEILDMDKLNDYQKLGLIDYRVDIGKKNYIRLTDKGLMMHSYIVPRLLK
ncbi:radical SAM family heme chaperone HemW [Candidatus Tisiphia endosymbiont of Beris chalybata]|uniref:radical SAM family heme chaperone HemW n=1 Tax=Candidatus Tisiphia endosymbiont of Beris chalybata TaxID=3066262 RepID=UPI00312C8580